MACRFICSICLDDYTKPKIIDCHHTFCEKCLADHIRNFSRNNMFPCPLCRRDVPVPDGGAGGFSSNIYLADAPLQQPSNAAPENITKCDICPVNKQDAAYYCKECNQFMCPECKSTHDSFSGCFSHIVLPIEEINLFAPANSKTKEKIYCPKHLQNTVEFYCKDCCQTLCYKCSATIHTGHKIQDIDDEVKLQATQEIEKLKHDIGIMKRQIEEHLESLVFGISTIQASSITTCEQVDKQVEVVCNEVRSLGENVKQDIRKTNTDGEKALNKLSTDLKTIKSEIEKSLNKASCVFDTDSAVLLINSIPKLRQQMLETSNTEFIVPERTKVVLRPGSPNPETLLKIFGNLEYRNIGEFQSSFNLDMVEGKDLGVSSHEFIIKNRIRCNVVVSKKSGSCCATLYTNRKKNHTNGYPHEMLPNITCSFILELVNNDSSLSSMTRIDQTPSTENHMINVFNWSDAIDWKTLSNPQAGFIDESNNFILRVTALYKN